MMYLDQTALVLGLGESGLAMALWLARGGAAVRVADTREAPERLAALQAAVPQAQFIAGAFTADLLDGVDFVAVSPGLAPHRELAAIAPAAAAKNIPVWGEIELFAQALAALNAGTRAATKCCSTSQEWTISAANRDLMWHMNWPRWTILSICG